MYGQQTAPECHISDVQQFCAESKKLDRAFYNITMYPGNDGGTANYGTVGAPIIYPIGVVKYRITLIYRWLIHLTMQMVTIEQNINQMASWMF